MPLQLTDPIPAKTLEEFAGFYITLIPGAIQGQQEVYIRFAQLDGRGGSSQDEQRCVKLTGVHFQEFLQQFGFNAQAVWEFLIERGYKAGAVV